MNLQTWATVGDVAPTQSGWNYYDDGYAIDPPSPWDVGDGSEELNGTFNMMGNVWEWMENPIYYHYTYDSDRCVRGGSYHYFNKSIYSIRSSFRGFYDPSFEIYVTGFRVASIPEPTNCTLSVDIKPQSCPNPINVKSKGVFDVAILGTEEFDVLDIDVTTITLEGVSPIQIRYKDETAPVVDGQECECHSKKKDGYIDLSLKFDTQEIVAALGEVSDGDMWMLHLTGALQDGTEIEGTDCIEIKKKGKK